MIRPIDIRLNAAHPDYPLAEAVTFTGAPSTVLVRGVPPNCGRWAITAVSVAATYPDGSTTTRAAVQSANGVWVATLPATATSGRTENGLRVMADGIDENGAAVTGYILGVADFAVASLGVTPAPEPGETSWQMLYFDAVPGTLRKGDVAKVDGVLKLYNGTAWEAFAGDIPAPSTATPAMDGTGAAGTSAAFARGDHVHPSDTSRVPTSRTVNGKALSSDVTLDADDIGALPAEHDGSYYNLTDVGIDDLNLPSGTHVNGETPILSGDVVAPDSSATSGKVADAEATYQALAGKQNALSAQQLANIAAVPNKANDADVVHKTGDEAIAGVKTFSDYVRSQFFMAYNGDNTGSLYPDYIYFSAYGRTNYLTFPDSQQSDYPNVRYNGFDVLATRDYVQWATPYALGTPIVINTASSETVEGETVNYGSATLANRTANIVQVTAATALDELRITFPAATSGKVRDFGLRVEIGTGSAALTAPALVPVAPTGETIKIENNAAEIPALADGTATAKGVTLLYFSENAPGVFVVKGEQVEEVA